MVGTHPSLPPATGPAKVWLVGAGPGAADLLTLRAARLLQSADVIVHDGLVEADVLAMARPDARLISVAKQRSRHSVPQAGINAILIAEARAGYRVVRLKGGDPFIFGRGGEEVEALILAGVAVEVVPGISAAIGCAAQARLPLTHRDAASVVSFVAGQCKGLSDQVWTGLAGPGRTLVIYMGLANAADIAAKLMAEGLGADTPIAVVADGTRPNARVHCSHIADLGALVAREAIASPAIIIVGDAVAHAHVPAHFASLAARAEEVI